MPVTLTLTSPNGGEFWQGTSDHPITWTSNFSTGTVTLKYSRDGGKTYPYTVATEEENDGEYPWSVPPVTSNTVRVRAELKTHHLTVDTSDADFTIDYSAPVVSVVSPNGGEMWEAGSTHEIRWIATDNFGLNENPVTLKYSTDGGATFPHTIVTGEVNDSTHFWSTPPQVFSDRLRVRVEVQNTKGLVGYDVCDGDVRLINPPPCVSGLPDTSFDNSSSGGVCIYDLDSYVQDNNDEPSTLTWSYWVSNDSVKVYIDQEDRYCTMIAPEFEGKADLVLTATDPHGASDSDTLIVTVFGTTGLSDDPDAALPTEFCLYQNYPNPFNPATTVAFDLPKPCEVKITIFNINGKRITTLFEGRKEAGRYTLTWDASGCPSGMYILRIRAEGFVQIRKCILLK